MTVLFKFLSVMIFNFCNSGKFIYTTENFFESIELLENNKFFYEVRMHMGVKLNVQGSYVINDDSLYLNSYPQHDKIIVTESKSKNAKLKTILNVRRKDKSFLIYHLYIVLEDGSNLVLRDQFKQTVVSGKIKEFYLVDTKGIKSPIFKIKGLNVNVFDILFETTRVFENESWAIKRDSLIPKGFDGEFQKYALTKSD